MTETKTEGTSVTLTHHAEAPIERVFRAFTDASELKRWFGPGDMVVNSAEMDARVGGAYRIEMHSPDDEIYTVKGVIQELSEPDTIVYTWSWEEDDQADEHESLETPPARLYVGVLGIAVLYFGIAFGPLLRFAEQGTTALGPAAGATAVVSVPDENPRRALRP